MRNVLRSVVLFGLCGCAQVECSAQWDEYDRDSVVALLDPKDHSTAQLQRYSIMATSWMLSSKAYPYLEHMDTLSRMLLKSTDPSTRDYAGYIRGLYHFHQGYHSKFRRDIPGALAHFAECERIQKERSGPNSTANLEEAIGALYRAVGETGQAIRTLQEALPKARTVKEQDPMRESSIRIELAGAYSDRGEWANALEELARCDTSFTTIRVLYRTQRALVYERQGEFQRALQDLDAALAAAALAPNPWDSLGVLAGMARLKMRTADLPGALRAANACTDLGRRTGDEMAECSCLALAGEVHMLMGNDGKAEENLQEALKIARAGNYLGLARNTGGEGAMVHTAGLLRDLYLRKGELRRAIDMSTYWSTLKDTLNRMDGRVELLRSDLQRKSVVDSLEFVQNAEQERILHRVELQREMDHRRIITAAGVVVGLVLLLLTFLLVKRLQQAKRLTRQEKLLHDQYVDELMHEHEIDAINSMLEGQEKERDRVAKDLHDHLGGMLSAIKHQLGSVGTDVLDARQDQGAHYAKMHSMLDEAVGEVRRISHDMLTVTLSRFGLDKALEDLCDSVRVKGKLDVELRHFGTERRMGRTLEIAVYRIVQEAISNMLKHADATELSVDVTRGPGRVSVIVHDNGKGFDPRTPGTGIGLENMRQRAASIGAVLRVESTPGKGTSISVEGPVAE